MLCTQEVKPGLLTDHQTDQQDQQGIFLGSVSTMYYQTGSRLASPHLARHQARTSRPLSAMSWHHRRHPQ
jgi:hypothetical protein